MAIMLEQLDVRPGHRVLEIGAGTGYNAALLAFLTGDPGEVVTVDLDDDIVAGARAHLQTAGFDHVRVVQADGGLGYAERAPYDRIVLTVGAWDIAPAWIEQLAPGGRLLLPLWLRGPQLTVAFERAADHLVSTSISSCAFMRLRGAFAGPESFVSLGPGSSLTLGVNDGGSVNPVAVASLLAGPTRDLPTGIAATPREGWDGLSFWLALREPGFCHLSSEVGIDQGNHPVVPRLLGATPTYRWAIGLHETGALALLVRSLDEGSPRGQARPAGAEGVAEPVASTLVVQSFGDDDALARRLVNQVVAWNAAGRPSTEGLRMRAYPLAAGYLPQPGESIIDKRWTRLVIDWA